MEVVIGHFLAFLHPDLEVFSKFSHVDERVGRAGAADGQSFEVVDWVASFAHHTPDKVSLVPHFLCISGPVS